MVVMIKMKKVVWAKIDHQNVVADPDQNQQNQYGNNKMISFGSLIIGFICLYPCVATAYILTIIEDHIDPMSLNEFPNKWYIYASQFFHPAMLGLSLSCYYFVTSKELRRETKEVLGKIRQIIK